MINAKCKICNKTLNNNNKHGYICKQCYNKRSRYRRKNTPPQEFQFNAGKPWSMNDIRYLKRYGKSDDLEELGYALGRSIGAIAQKKSELMGMREKDMEPWQLTKFYVDPKHKKCSRCLRVYPADNKHFYKDNSKNDKLMYTCIRCERTAYHNNKVSSK